MEKYQSKIAVKAIMKLLDRIKVQIRKKHESTFTFEFSETGIRQIVVQKHNKCIYNLISVELTSEKLTEKIFATCTARKLIKNNESSRFGMTNEVLLFNQILQDLNYVVNNWDDI